MSVTLENLVGRNIAFPHFRVHGCGVVARDTVRDMPQRFLPALEAELEALLADPGLG